jgi:hypothetical protein
VQLILTSKPRLIYIDPIRMKQKGEIPWSDNLYVNSKSATAFDVVTVRPSLPLVMERTYLLTSVV